MEAEQKRKTLKTYFGYDTFRSGQEEIIDQLLAGRDVLAVMPTGAGKSLCYQLPALLMPGTTIVVSPLISLMMDQVKALNEAGVHAAYINSSLSEGQTARALELARAGRYKLIYVAPERLETPRFLDFACHAQISMITVDEAHCISQWGQDFRPSYVRILSFIRQLPLRPVVSAFTATATEKVRQDILASLELEQPYETVAGFDRPNLYFEVQRARDKKERVRRYLTDHSQDSGIVYCATRKAVDELYLYLENAGFSVGRYHAGMSADARKMSQEDFIYDRIRVIIATNAFGMGIDKSNVRFVLHYHMPQSMENYYQEAGRAGRDGEPAECILYYSPQDTMIGRLLLESKEMDETYTEEERRTIREQDAERLRKMEGYCTTTGCLRSYILRYFGEKAEDSCGNCGNCLTEFEQMDAAEAAADVVRCVRECGQRYGQSMIAGTLLGENTARIRDRGMDKSSVYGKQSKLGKARMQEVIRTMVERGYLCQTKDKYTLLKLTESSESLLEETQPFYISYRKEEEKAGKKLKASGASGRRPAQMADLTEGQQVLFEELRKLRMRLAGKRKIPPYMVASDKTLRDMCVRLPRTREELLDVNGMGEKKVKQYGEAFLEVLLKKGI
ncbi:MULTISPECIES: DNA helicase RecQ [Eubacteriales]|uniref:DNA helicase RecQ n=1 Tax=Eubacteriales TaxID=186802 RepID=UPI0011067C40|nr:MULTISPECIES: DNA helicase RecQ [Eubacteriales]HIX98140.1 DNA helicase RecQ [Candidatus Dorea intestinigallinarum]